MKSDGDKIKEFNNQEEEVTKEVEKIEDIENIEESKEVAIKEENVEKEKLENKELEEKEKNNKKKKIIIIVLVVLIVLILATWSFLSWKESKKKEKIKDEVYKEEKLTEKEIEKKIKTYGEAMEKVISISYTKENKILTYEEAVKLIHNSDDIVCNIHEIYEDGKVYLDECSYAGKRTKYSYGKKQEPKQIDESKTIAVYVNKSSKVATLKKPNDISNYDVYTVDAGSEYQDVDLFGKTEYVLYFDSEYVVHMKNYVTGKDIFSELNPKDIRVFTNNEKYDTSYVALLINDKWAIYNIDTSKAIVANIYDHITTIYSGTGTYGPQNAIAVINDFYVLVSRNNSVGIINYKTGKELIPIQYQTVSLGTNYLFASTGDTGYIYDFNGKTYLTGELDKIYDITKGDYVIAQDNDRIILANISGKVIYDFGDSKDVKGYFYSFEYDGKLLVQFSKNNAGNCIEYSYDLEKKTGEVNDTECAGVAKPILYLYPEKETDVTVKFSNPEILETTYPKFNGKWEVKAKSNGDLYDKSGKYYYALYWDEKKVHSVDFSEGFYVDKDDAIDFLEKKLSYIGLNDKERNEFIMYWLPVMEKNGKNLVYFELTDERESYNKLLISPKPDSMLRLVIHIKKVDKKVNIPKQSLSKFRRVGFTAVEWGGTTY